MARHHDFRQLLLGLDQVAHSMVQIVRRATFIFCAVCLLGHNFIEFDEVCKRKS